MKPEIEQRRPWLATVRQAVHRELLNHIGAKVKYLAEEKAKSSLLSDIRR